MISAFKCYLSPATLRIFQMIGNIPVWQFWSWPQKIKWFQYEAINKRSDPPDLSPSCISTNTSPLNHLWYWKLQIWRAWWFQSHEYHSKMFHCLHENKILYLHNMSAGTVLITQCPSVRAVISFAPFSNSSGYLWPNLFWRRWC